MSLDTARPHAAVWDRLIGWYAVTVFVMGTGAFVVLTAPEAAGPSMPPGMEAAGSAAADSYPPFLAFWAGAYLVALAILVSGWARSREPVYPATVLLVFVLLALTSTVWSVNPGVTGRRAIALAGTVAIGAALASRLTALQVLEYLRRAIVVVAVVSLLLYLARTPQALDPVHGTLRGVLATRNSMGRMMALGMVASVAVAILDRSSARRVGWWAVPILAALVLSQSVAGTIVAVLAPASLALVAARWSGPARDCVVVVGSAGVGVTAWAALLSGTSSWADIAGLAGRDTTLTGRTEIWARVWTGVEQYPLLGHGFGAFWHPDGDPLARNIRLAMHYEVPHAHNGLLDVAVDLGAIGVAVAVLITVTLGVSGISALRSGDRATALLRLSAASYLVLSNVAESNFLVQNTVATVLVAVALSRGTGLSARSPTPGS